MIPGTKLDARMVQDSLTAEEIGTIRKRLESVVDTGCGSRVEELRGWLRDQQAIPVVERPERPSAVQRPGSRREPPRASGPEQTGQ